MRVVNGTASRRGAAPCPRPARANAFFARYPPPPPRNSDDNENQRRGFQASGEGLMGGAPQVRVRQANDRAKEQLGELALLNERLMGQDSWRIRQKVEYLKSKRKAWQGVYNAACKQEISLTVAHIESAMAEVDEALKEGGDEYQSITDARAELVELLAQVEEAHERLHLTQARVEQNVQKLTELKAEAAEFARLKELTPELPASHPDLAAPQGIASVPDAATSTANPQRVEAAPAARSAAAPQKSRQGARGLQSSLNLEPGLRNFWYDATGFSSSLYTAAFSQQRIRNLGFHLDSKQWCIHEKILNRYAAAFSSKLKSDTLVPIELFGQPWVLFRDPAGHAACVRDECAHRACPLSAGSVVDGQVQCPYHGWTFNSQGECTKMPSTVQCKGIKVSHLPTVERDGLVWIWPGDGEPVDVPDNTLPPGSFTLHSEIEVEVPVEHGLLMENLLDLAHAPFTHTSTFAKGWPVPDAVKFHAQKLLGGNWDPYPIDMSFEPPCMVLSTIGLKQPGQIEAGAQAVECDNHLHQLHICLPSRKGHTRLLYRMHLDFMPWIKHVPFIDKFWEYIAGQVLGEDLVLVQGQQDRMQRGGDTWKSPVSYDKLAVRYRRWRNNLDANNLPPSAYASQGMDAGNLFSLDEDEVLTSVKSSARSPSQQTQR